MAQQLTEHQKEALSSYRQMMNEHPDLFKLRHQRPIVRDFDELESYAIKNNTVIGVAAITRYVYFVVDLVNSRLADGTFFQHPYLRVISIGQLKGGRNVVIIASIQNASLGNLDDIVLLEQERHATGFNQIELPRGFAESHLSGEENALKELREETGYVSQKAYLIGSTYTDSGLTDSKVFFYYIPVTSYQSTSNEIEEAIKKVSLSSIENLWKLIDNGQVSDGFTLQALALYMKWKQEI